MSTTPRAERFVRLFSKANCYCTKLTYYKFCRAAPLDEKYADYIAVECSEDDKEDDEDDEDEDDEDKEDEDDQDEDDGESDDSDLAKLAKGINYYTYSCV